MEGLLKQVRSKIRGNEDIGSFREGRNLPQRTPSFRGEKKPQKWLKRQFSREMSFNHSIEEAEYAAAVAAAAFAVRELDSDAMDHRRPEPERRTSLPRVISGLINSAFSAVPGEPPKHYADENDYEASRMVPEKTIHPVPSIKRNPTTPKKRLTFADELAEDPSKPSMYETPRFGEEEWKEAEQMKPTSIPSSKRTPSMKKTPSFGKEEMEDGQRMRPFSIPSFRRTPTVKKTPSFSEESMEEIRRTKSPKRRAPEPMLPPPIPPPPAVPPLYIQPLDPPTRAQRQRGQENDADAWEREEMAKIKQRYEKLNATILEWEDKKKKKARRKLETTEVRVKFNHYSTCEKIRKAILTKICLQQSQREPEKRRVKAMHKYQNEMERIKQIADGARAQASDKKRNEEIKVREKASKYRATGERPRTCFCL